MNAFQIQCPSCQSKLKVPISAAGSKVRCSKCKQVLLIPQSKAAGAQAAGAQAASRKPAQSQPQVRAAAQPSPLADPFADPSDPLSAPMTNSGSFQSPASGFPSAPAGQTPSWASGQQAGATKSAAAKSKDNPVLTWIVGGVSFVVAFVIVGGLVAWLMRPSDPQLTSNSTPSEAATSSSATSSTSSARDSAAAEIANAAANAPPLPNDWATQGTHGVRIALPADAKVREIASPAKGPLMFQAEGSDGQDQSKYRLLVMPLPPGTEVRRDQWLRNVFQYSSADVREEADVRRGDRPGKRLRLETGQSEIDPLIEFFVLPDSIVIASAQPASASRAERFFASLELPADSSASSASSPLASNTSGNVAGDNPASDKTSADMPANDRGGAIAANGSQTMTPTQQRHKQIYLEYRKFASANSSRKALPGIRARDAIDRLVGDINESQVQAFLVLHDLSEAELNKIISEGNDKNWAE